MDLSNSWGPDLGARAALNRPGRSEGENGRELDYPPRPTPELHRLYLYLKTGLRAHRVDSVKQAGEIGAKHV